MYRRPHAKKASSKIANAVHKAKDKVRPDNTPGAKRRHITICENGRNFRIPVSGPKGNWLWEQIDNKLLCAIIKARIKERGISSRAQLEKSKPYGSRLLKKAKDRGIIDGLLPAKQFGRRKKTKAEVPDTSKPDQMDKEEFWRIRREVTKWMEDDAWWNNFGKDNKTSD
jgi:hypothetical protein